MTEDDHGELVVRLNKLNLIKGLDNVVFKDKFERTHTIAEVLGIYSNVDKTIANSQLVRVAGRVISMRLHGKLAFLDVKDSSGKIQVCLKNDILGKEGYDSFCSTVDVGDYIGFEGDCFYTQTGILTILLRKYSFLSKSLRPLPASFYGLQDVEKRYRQRYLDLILNEEVMSNLKVRYALVQKIREWLVNKDFTEINTRILQPQAGGAMAKPFFTHHNALDHDFALRISPELDLKMAVISGFERVFEFAINFRNEGIDPSHLQEFQMLEWYCAYENYEVGMQWTEEMLKQVIPAVLGKSTFIVYDRQGNICEININQKFKVVTFGEIFAEHGVDIFANKETLAEKARLCGITEEEISSRSRGNLLDDIYKKLIRPNIIQPTFITHYPADLLPLARPNDENNNLADSYQLVVASWEIVKGYSELIDPILQRKALQIQAKEKNMGDEEAMDVNEEYLVAMEHALPPVTGCGIGIDRLATIITGQKNLKDLVLFPLVKPDSGYDYI